MSLSQTSIDCSIVVPVYACAETLGELVDQVKTHTAGLFKSIEIVLVNDGSADHAWAAITSLAASHPEIKGINLSRNFGQHNAIMAGLSHAVGQWVIVMDCDLQDRPDQIPQLFAKVSEGFDMVLAQRTQRKDGVFKRFGSKMFYRLFSYLTGTRQDPSVANFGIYNQQVVKAVLDMGDHIKYFPTMVQWVGYSRAYVPVEHHSRSTGASSYTFSKLMDLAINTMIAFSDKPLKLTIKLGLSVSGMAILIALFYLIKYYRGEIVVLGWASLIVSIWLLSGLIIFILGIIGIYIGKTFEKVKNRPNFIIKDKINLP